MDSIECAKQKVRTIIAGSSVPEDPLHAENTLLWLLRLEPRADTALQLAALAHDLDRAREETKVQRADFAEYDAFKAAHADHGAAILRRILEACGVKAPIIEEACRLVRHHESGGDPRSDLLKEADSVSFFEVNLPLYYQREGREETMRRCVWGYHRLSPRTQKIVRQMTCADPDLTALLKAAIRQAGRNQVIPD